MVAQSRESDQSAKTRVPHRVRGGWRGRSWHKGGNQLEWANRMSTWDDSLEQVSESTQDAYRTGSIIFETQGKM